MARKCAVCGQNADTFMSTANTINDCVLCSNCYQKIKSFNYRETFDSLEAIETKQNEVITELENMQYPADVIQSFNQFYNAKKEPYVYAEISTMITTTPAFEGYHITKYHGIVSGKVTLGTGFISSFDAGIANTFGSESTMYTDKLNACEKEAVKRAMILATKNGGNAIVGAKVDYESFSQDLMCVVVSGTAVTIEPDES